MSDKKITKFQIGTGANAQIVEVSNNEEALETLKTELNATIEALQAQISLMASKIRELEERMNSIDDETPSGKDDSSSMNSMNSSSN